MGLLNKHGLTHEETEALQHISLFGDCGRIDNDLLDSLRDKTMIRFYGWARKQADVTALGQHVLDNL